MGRLGIGERKVAKKSRDSRRKNELITSQCIPKYIYEGEYKV